MSPSCPYQSVAVDATTMLCASIILPMTPPELLEAAISTGESPSCSADTFCSPPNSTLEDVSEPVSATPSQPSLAPKKGYSQPACANARPSVESSPAPFVVKPGARLAAMVSNE